MQSTFGSMLVDPQAATQGSEVVGFQQEELTWACKSHSEGRGILPVASSSSCQAYSWQRSKDIASQREEEPTWWELALDNAKRQGISSAPPLRDSHRPVRKYKRHGRVCFSILNALANLTLICQEQLVIKLLTTTYVSASVSQVDTGLTRNPICEKRSRRDLFVHGKLDDDLDADCHAQSACTERSRRALFGDCFPAI